MTKFLSPFLLPALISGATCLLAAGPHEPSKAFLEAFLRHKDRVVAGHTDILPLLNELKPLAESGDPTAQFYIGILSINESPQKAIPLLRASAKAGCPGAAGALGIYLLQDNPTEALAFFKFAAEAGDANSTFCLSIAYLQGRHGIKKDPSMGLALAKLARKQSYSAALSSGLDNLIQTTERDLPEDSKNRSSQLFSSLQAQFPKVPFYLGSQSLP